MLSPKSDNDLDYKYKSLTTQNTEPKENISFKDVICITDKELYSSSRKLYPQDVIKNIPISLSPYNDTDLNSEKYS